MSNYYVCDKDVLPHLRPGTKYCYVDKQTYPDKFRYVYGDINSASILIPATYIAEEELTILSLKSTRIEKCTFKELSAYIQIRIYTDPIWYFK